MSLRTPRANEDQHLFLSKAKMPYGLALAAIILFILSWGIWSFFLGSGIAK